MVKCVICEQLRNAWQIDWRYLPDDDEEAQPVCYRCAYPDSPNSQTRHGDRSPEGGYGC